MEQLSAETLSALCWQLALLHEAGMPSAESVALLAGDATDRRLSALLTDLAEKLQGGGNLSAAMTATGVFPNHLLRMLEIGEATGRTDQVLSALTDYYRREAELRGNLRRALTYPAMMTALIAVVFSILLTQVLPVFSQVFRQLGLEPSALTQSLMSFGGASKYAAGILCVVLVGGALFWSYRIRRGGRLPLFRAAVTVDRSRFAAAMSLMLASGLPLDEAMERTGLLLEGTPLAPRVAKCREKMQAGEAFAPAVAECGILTALQAGLLSTGARGGAADRAMSEVADRCRSEADAAVARLLSWFEFTLALVLCVAVGLVLLSVMLPLVGVLSAIG